MITAAAAQGNIAAPIFTRSAPPLTLFGGRRFDRISQKWLMSRKLNDTNARFVLRPNKG
jgi:hypothetical protein